MASDDPFLNLHLQTDRPIEVGQLTAALGSLSRQYQRFAVYEGVTMRPADARLLVSTVSRGSIDISFIPDWVTVGTLLVPHVAKYELIQKFAGHIKTLIEYFAARELGSAEISIKDCEDAINIVKPVAQSGGSQQFLVVHGDVHATILSTTASKAKAVLEGAARQRAVLQPAQGEVRQRVSMVWTQLNRDEAKTEGVRSPDRGLIQEIDPKDHAVLFTDDLTYLKSEMIADDENPYQKVYFVDVDISRAGGRITAYRIMVFHGKEDL